MDFPAGALHVSLLGVRQHIGPADGRTFQGSTESLIRTAYDQCHPGETFDDLKRRRSSPRKTRDYCAIGWPWRRNAQPSVSTVPGRPAAHRAAA